MLRTPTFLLVLLLFAAGCSAASKLRDRAMTGLGSMAANLLTQKTDDLGATNVSVVYQSNLYPQAVPSYETSQLKDGWIEGGDYLAVSLFKRAGIGMYRLDGAITADGEEVPNALAGTYVRLFEGSAPRTLAIAAANGTRFETSVTPRPPIRIVSVNGQGREGAEVDLSGPLTIEVERQSDEPTEMRVTLLGNAVGVRTFLDVATVRGTNRIELPAGTFRHTPKARDYDRGASWLMVEEYGRSRFEPMPTGGMQVVLVKASDAVPVNVSGTFDRIDGLGVEGKVAAPGGRTFEYHAEKPPAFAGNAMLPGKKLALVTFTARATELSQTRSTTSTSEALGVRTTTTTTRSRQFAQLPDVFWDDLVGRLHADLTGALQRHWQAEFVPVDRVVASPMYQAFRPVEEENTAVVVERTYGGLRTLFGQSVRDILTDTSGPFAIADYERLMDDLGVDGLVAVTLDLQMPFEEFSLTPRLRFFIFGREPSPGTGGFGAMYAQGWVAGAGQEVTNEMLDDPQQLAAFLPTAINHETLVAAFDRALGELAEKERQDPVYEAVWRGR